MKSRKSIFSDEWRIYFLTKNKEFKPLFDKFGLAFSALLLNKKMIFIDGEKFKAQKLSKNHLYAIEAHEIGHYIAGHFNKQEEDNDEVEADRIGIEILLQNNMVDAAKILINRLWSLNVNYEEIVLSDDIKSSLKIYTKK